MIDRSSRKLVLGTDALALLAAAFFVVTCNGAFWRAAMSGRSAADPHTWLFAAATALALLAIHVLLLGLVLHRRIARPLLALLFIATAFATYYMQSYGVVLDPAMLRNVLATDVKEARELFVLGMLPHLLLYAGLPILVLWRIEPAPRPLGRALLHRAGLLALALVVLLAALFAVFADVSALMRNRKELRYMITPANYIYSLARAAGVERRQASRPLQTVGADAKPSPRWAGHERPALFVFVVGETARAANWGLNGYARQTTPELAALPGVIAFTDVRSCGTDTETSLPCMFSQIGRRDYDEDRIRGSESLLHVLARAGFKVVWRDNQSGCKGVCRDLGEERLTASEVPGLCVDGRCFDEALLEGLDTIARDTKGNLFVVLHMLGNHGPAYYKRYPPAWKRYTPACETEELRNCSREEIVNAYDNALLYTDHVLARTIARLDALAGYDTAMIYVSDHGESLGENGLYLHGVPYAIAPEQQTEVPMVWWLSPRYARSFGIDAACLAAKRQAPASHDHLFHSILGMLDVATTAYDRAYDLSADCTRR